MVQCHRTKADAGTGNRTNAKDNAVDRQRINGVSILRTFINYPPVLLRFEKCLSILKIILTGYPKIGYHSPSQNSGITFRHGSF
jgi:hypothetical protein